MAGKLFFPLEHCLIHGNDLSISSSKETSVLFFTSQKCASTLMPKIFKYFEEHCLQLNPVDFATYLNLTTSTSPYVTLPESPHILFYPKGMLYGPLRKYIPISGLKSFRIILMLRDPRDVLVSSYFSQAYSHSPPMNRSKLDHFIQRRERTRSLSIDEFALKMAEEWAHRYRAYANNLLGQSNVTFLKYEDMILSTEKWLSTLAGALDIDLTKSDIANIYKIGQFNKAKTNNINDHIRHALPGEHKNRLSIETQNKLNVHFADVLEAFGYKD